MSKTIAILAWSLNIISGTGTLSRTLIKGLQSNQQVKFLVVSPQPFYLDDPNLKKHILSHSQMVISNFEKKQYLSLQQWLNKATKKLDDQVNVLFYLDNMVSSYQRHASIVTLLHDVLPLSLSYYYFNPFVYFREKKKYFQVAQLSNAIITISNYSKRMIQKKLNVEEDNIHLIYNGIESDLYHDQTSLSEHLENRKGILYVGDLTRRKNVMSLVNAYLQLNSEIQEMHPLILCAKGKLKKKIVDRFTRKGCLKNLQFYENCSILQLHKLYQSAKVFVFPSIMEGFGLPVIEAQNHHLPVICGDHSSLGEITNQTAYYIDVRNSAQITNGITKLINDSQLYHHYSTSGYRNSLRFSPTIMVEQYQKFFENFTASL